METKIIVCNSTQIRVEFKCATVRGVDHDGSCWFEFLADGTAKPIGRYQSYGSPVLAHRTGSILTEATKAAKVKLEEICKHAVWMWLADGGLSELTEAGRSERLEAVADAERALEAAIAAVADATAKLEAARLAAGI